MSVPADTPLTKGEKVMTMEEFHDQGFGAVAFTRHGTFGGECVVLTVIHNSTEGAAN